MTSGRPFPRARLAGALALVPAALLVLPAAAQRGSPPVADAGGPYLVECQGATTLVQMDATGSYDPDGTPLTFLWFEECPDAYFDDPTSPTPLLVVTGATGCGYSCKAIDLTVSSGGQSAKTHAKVTVRDTLAPVLVVPGDVYQPWGLDTGPATMGQAQAYDLCSGTSLSFQDLAYTPPEKGIERIIERTWTAVDACGNRAAKVQRIHLLGLAAGAYNLEVEPGTCSDDFLLNDPSPTVTVYLGGRVGLKVADVDPSRLHVSVRELPSASLSGAFVTPLGANDMIRAIAGTPIECNPLGQDVYFDLPLVIERKRLCTQAGLNAFAGGNAVLLTLAGQRWDGSWFWAQTALRVL